MESTKKKLLYLRKKLVLLQMCVCTTTNVYSLSDISNSETSMTAEICTELNQSLELALKPKKHLPGNISPLISEMSETNPSKISNISAVVNLLENISTKKSDVESNEMVSISEIISQMPPKSIEKSTILTAGVSAAFEELLTKELEDIYIPKASSAKKNMVQKAEEPVVTEEPEECFTKETLIEYIKEVSPTQGIPSEIVLSIIEQESGTQWNTNGVISVSNDYGLTQINKRNLKWVCETLGCTEDDILYNPYINIDASIFILQTIFKQHHYTIDNFIYEEVFGTYNGWIDWRNNETSQNYVKGCMMYLNEKYKPTKGRN